MGVVKVMMRNILLTIEYDGTNYFGWQRQKDLPSVQGEVERVLSILCGQPIEINGTSRTDRGVHAYGQRASFKGEFGIPTDRIKYAGNNLLDSAVRIREVVEKPMDFHARYDSKGKTYVYKIANRLYESPFERNYCYTVNRPLDVEKMRQAAAFVVGTHDFKCFEASGGDVRESTVRTIFSLDIEATGVSSGYVAGGGCHSGEADSNDSDGRNFDNGYITLSVRGDGFLYNMVRIITGTLVDVGLGKIKPEDIPAIIESCDRTRAGHTAPPQGLYLKEIYY